MGGISFSFFISMPPVPPAYARKKKKAPRQKRSAQKKIKQKSADLSISAFGGSGWIRTTEARCSRFTVCPLWPLGNASRCVPAPVGCLIIIASPSGKCNTFFEKNSNFFKFLVCPPERGPLRAQGALGGTHWQAGKEQKDSPPNFFSPSCQAVRDLI